jgi:hypothetical protein
MMEILGYFFICTTAILGYAVYNLMKKVEHLEDIIEEQDLEYFKQKADIRETIKAMRAIDLREAFEKDDEVGNIFQGLKNIVEGLDVDND